MNRSIFSLLVCGGLIFSTLMAPQVVQAQGFSFPAEMNKSFSPLSIEAGGRSRLRVSVFNPNAFPLTDAGWTDNLAGVQPGILIASPPNVSNTCGGSVEAEPGGSLLTLSGGTVPAQTGSTPGSCTVSVDVTSTTPWNLINTIPAGALKSSGGGGTVTNTTPASATLHVSLVQPPTVSKSFSPNTMLVGQTSQMTIRIRNTDPGAALTQASLTDPFPAGVVLDDPVSPSLSGCGDSASVVAAESGSSVTLQGAVIEAGSTCSIRVNVTSSTAGIYSNIIPAGGLRTAEGLTNDAPATARLNVQAIGLAKKFSPATFQAGSTTTLTITLRNSTASAYTGVQVSDTLPGDVLTIVPDSAATTCGGTVSITPPRTVSLSDGRVPPGTPESPGSCTIIVQVTAPADAGPGSYRNTIPASSLATDQGITNGQAASSWVTISPAGGALGARKSFSPSTMAVDENSRLRVNIPAPQDIDLTNFSVTDNLPPGVTISNSSPASQSNCGPSAVLTAVTGAASFTLANATLRAGTVCQIDVYVTSRTPGLHTNVIRPADISNDQNRTIPDDIAADLTVTALSDFEISKAFTPPSVRPGGISTLRITLENRNTAPLVDASITDLLPGEAASGVVVAPTPNASTTCAGGTVTAEAGTQAVRLTGGTIPPRVGDVPGTCTVTVDVQGLGVLTTRTNTIPIENASARVEGTDTVLDPSQPARADLVIGELNIGVVKGFDPLTVFGGSASTLSIQLLNPNSIPLTGITLVDNMPAGMIVADPPRPSVRECGGRLDVTAGAESFTFRDGSLPAGASCFLTLQVTMTVNGNLTNTIQLNAVSASGGATNPRPAEATLTNLPGASIDKGFAPNPIEAGSVSTLTFTIRNTGTVALSGLAFRDVLPGDLPVGLEIAASPAPVNTCGGILTAAEGTQLIALADGTLGLNSSCTITVGVTGRIAGSFTTTIEPGRLGTNEGATNPEAATDTLMVTGGNGGGGGGSGTPPDDEEEVSGFLIPVTGFAPHTLTPLDRDSRPRYGSTGLQLEIPSISVKTSIVGVPILDGGWDIAWLQDQVGWLNGTAYPTWEGNSVLTGHVVNADGNPGVFARLGSLKTGDYLFVHISGYRYTYRVASNREVGPGDVSVLKHLDDPHLTLITCDDYDVRSASYRQRIAVRARLVDVRAAP